MRLLLHRIAVLLCLGSGLAWASVPARATEVEQDNQALAEHSGEIFFGTIDIVTAVFAVQSGIGPAVNTEYTVLVSDVLKGNLRPQMMVVVRQDGGGADFADGDGPLAPGSEYLFFARYDPALLRYVITEPATGNVPVTSPEQRAELTAHWSDVAQQTACPYRDVLTLDGVVYARRDWNADKRYLDREQVGPSIATVAIQDTSATGCRADLADRTASRIPAGTKIQSVDGYASTFRVAVRLRTATATSTKPSGARTRKPAPISSISRTVPNRSRPSARSNATTRPNAMLTSSRPRRRARPRRSSTPCSSRRPIRSSGNCARCHRNGCD